MTRYARRNPEAVLPAWLTVLDGARYFTREALATAVAESGWRSRTALVAMAPETFLALAYSGYMPEKAANVDAALRTTGAFWDVPYLMVEEDGDRAQVTGHEGRHRARALQALGVREMPVRIHARWLRWQETPEDAPRWLIPEKGGRGRTPVAMPPILGAARQNGGPRKSTPRAVVVDPDMLVVLIALVRWVRDSAAAELRNWGKHVNPQDVKVTSAHAVVYTTLKDGAARRAFYRLVKAGLLLPVHTREVTHSVRSGQGGASNFRPRAETRETTITDYLIADAGFALVDGR